MQNSEYCLWRRLLETFCPCTPIENVICLVRLCADTLQGFSLRAWIFVGWRLSHTWSCCGGIAALVYYPDYFCDIHRRPLSAYFDQRQKMRFVVLSDDAALAPIKAVKALQKHYCSAKIDTLIYEPRQLGVSNIGHFGFFSSKAPRQMWLDAVNWLLD